MKRLPSRIAIGHADGKLMCVEDLRAFLARCDSEGIPPNALIHTVRTKSIRFGVVGLKQLSADNADPAQW
jgi:hypothetical protein